MTKKEILWREILFQATENKKNKFTQKELAKSFGFSLSTVFNALKVPRETGAIKVSGRDFVVTDIIKFLNIWATFRKLKKEIIYKTHCPMSAKEIESQIVPNAIFGAFSAYRLKYNQAPADYDKVCVYIKKENLSEIEKRFPKQKGYENLIVFTADPWLEKFGKIAPDVQNYVDLWNLSEWYAKDFLNALKEKMKLE